MYFRIDTGHRPRFGSLPPPDRVKRLPSWKGSGTDGQGKGHEDVLVVPGDISSSLDRSAETLTELKERYDEVRLRARHVGHVDGL